MFKSRFCCKLDLSFTLQGHLWVHQFFYKIYFDQCVIKMIENKFLVESCFSEVSLVIGFQVVNGTSQLLDIFLNSKALRSSNLWGLKTPNLINIIYNNVHYKIVWLKILYFTSIYMYGTLKEILFLDQNEPSPFRG